MGDPSSESVKLWETIISCGLQEEFERDWLGRIKHRTTNRFIRAQGTPELIQMLAGAGSSLSIARNGATGALAAAREAVKRRLLASIEDSATKT